MADSPLWLKLKVVITMDEKSNIKMLHLEIQPIFLVARACLATQIHCSHFRGRQLAGTLRPGRFSSKIIYFHLKVGGLTETSETSLKQLCICSFVKIPYWNREIQGIISKVRDLSQWFFRSLLNNRNSKNANNSLKLAKILSFSW